MKPKPVRKYPSPKYPTRLEIAAQPDLLRRHQPPAWRKWPELTGAAGLFLLADTARLPAADRPLKDSQTPAQTNAVAVVAPIFQHGEGRGATGCIVMTPPVFLSEEEAMQVIREEMAAKGVQMGTNQTTLAGVTVQQIVWRIPSGATGATNHLQTAGPTFEIKQKTLAADATDPRKKVFIEFVGERDARVWDWERVKEEATKGGPFIIAGSVQSYDLSKTAAYVAERVKRQATDRIYFGTFYDPLAGTLHFGSFGTANVPPADAKSTGHWENVKSTNGGLTATWAGAGKAPAQLTNPKAESQRLLRLQVQDFLKWLQAQGAI